MRSAPQINRPGEDAVESAPLDCWNRIGIRGDRSCPQLSAHIHCRNCPVYSQAAQQLLDAADVAGELAAAAAPQQAASALDAVGQSLMVFRLASELFALPTRRCIEVLHARPIHRLPHRRARALLGVASIRGRLMLCLSLATLVQVAAAPEADTGDRAAGVPVPGGRLLLVEWPAGRVALAVDEVLGVQSPPPASLSRVPATVARARSCLVSALFPADGRTVGVLDDAQLQHAVQESLA
jgi:chemotaxis-related protein WspD